MLIDLFPRAHARFTQLTLLGTHLDGLARWLADRGFTVQRIRDRIRKAPSLELQLPSCGIRDLRELSQEQLLALAPRPARSNPHLSALVHSLAAFLDERGLLGAAVKTPAQRLVGRYLDSLERVRGYAASTVRYHRYTVSDLLAFLRFDDQPDVLRTLSAVRIEAFVQSVAQRCGRGSLQHTVSHLRSFLRFLANRGEAPDGLAAGIDRPRTFRGEQLPRALPWETVQAFLAGIDRTTAIGRRDYAMFLLMATYGLRSSEIAALRLDSIAWRAGELRPDRPKARKPLALPLTDEAGSALADYLRHARPASPQRAVFLGTRRPVAPLTSPGVQAAFRRQALRHGPEPFPDTGSHCLRHSLALRLLRCNRPLHEIGSLLGHRSLESTSQYLRLHADELRAVALDLPTVTENAR